jgi:hypothetical protein
MDIRRWIVLGRRRARAVIRHLDSIRQSHGRLARIS